MPFQNYRSQTTDMITDQHTNFLYLADTLPQKYPIFYERFANLLKELNIYFALLTDTKDV